MSDVKICDCCRLNEEADIKADYLLMCGHWMCLQCFEGACVESDCYGHSVLDEDA